MNNKPDQVIYAVYDNAATAFEIEKGVWPSMAKPETKTEALTMASELGGTAWELSISSEGITAKILKNE